MNKTYKKAAVIGYPIAQSLSPFIHTHWMGQVGMAGEYTAVEVKLGELPQFIEKAKAEGLSGFNITMPHKIDIVPLLDTVAPMARSMGAVNTVKINEDGSLSGFNTDGIGLLAHLKASVPDWPQDKPVLIMGAGGAARAAALAFVNESVPMVMITNRTREKATALADEIGRGRMTVVDWEDRSSALSGAGLLVNTTMLGMEKQPSLDIDLSGAAPDTVIYDIVYKPLETDLLASARAKGLRTVDGLGMLVHQGAAAFKIWFGESVGFDQKLREKLEAKIS